MMFIIGPNLDEIISLVPYKLGRYRNAGWTIPENPSLYQPGLPYNIHHG